MSLHNFSKYFLFLEFYSSNFYVRSKMLSNLTLNYNSTVGAHPLVLLQAADWDPPVEKKKTAADYSTFSVPYLTTTHSIAAPATIHKFSFSLTQTLTAKERCLSLKFIIFFLGFLTNQTNVKHNLNVKNKLRLTKKIKHWKSIYVLFSLQLHWCLCVISL